jgi:mannose-1-phosphate guanylyltransferase/mannose-6-phosphate isomerase
MSAIDIQPVILCGGSGTRLWPLSRAGFPKQFLALTGNDSLFQQAAQRLTTLDAADIAAASPLIVGNEEHRFLMQEQLREVGLDPASILLEPSGRNTAPALALAALAALASGTDPVLVVTPADQTVAAAPAFAQALQLAVREAASGAVVVLGIKPLRAETGYGYICATGAGPSAGVARFVEKPDAATAAQYLSDGRYYWNAGIFVLRASTWMAALERFRPDIAAAAKLAWSGRSTDAKFVRPDKAAFSAAPAVSVDYAVMEKLPGSGTEVRMVALDAGWSDLGAWDSVWQALPHDATGNASFGDTLLNECSNTLIHASSRLVGAIGLKDVVVVETADAVLVADRARSQDVKHIVAALEAEKRAEHIIHRKVHRPWGWYDCIDEGPRFKVKRIMVKPKASLSLQKHHHRAEHWVVVSGTAEVTCGEKTLLVSENQSTYIPLGEMHRLANPGKVPLEIIEIQSGAYLGEDDIVRFDDSYGRKSEP